ncbi:MAG: hypothetical protein IJH39_01735, partial [Clostridia bacterium]|nr:hypothetical protein [Clostridia bacterium]
MKKYVFIVTTLITMLTICLAFTNISNAGGVGCTIEVTTSNTSLNPGDEFTVTVRMKNVTVTQGIEAIGLTNLDYNSNAFEIVGSELNTAKWKWNSEDVHNKVITVSGQGETTDQVVGTITFRVKANASAGSYTIKSVGAYTKPVEAQVNQEFQNQIEVPLTIKSAVVPPVTQTPVTPAPVTPTPVTPAPVTPTPVTPTPVTPTPVTPTTVTPTTATPTTA